MTSRARHGGYALLELVIAVMIFVVLAAMAYGGLDAATRARAEVSRHAERLRDIQLAVTVLDRDLRETLARPARGGYGQRLPALAGEAGTLEFTHASGLRVSNSASSLLERVRYGLLDTALARWRYPVLDRAVEQPPPSRELLSGVREFHLSYLDGGGQWRDTWPPRDGPGAGVEGLPRAVQYRLVLDDLGEITRRVVLIDGAVDPTLGPP